MVHDSVLTGIGVDCPRASLSLSLSLALSLAPSFSPPAQVSRRVGTSAHPQTKRNFSKRGIIHEILRIWENPDHILIAKLSKKSLV